MIILCILLAIAAPPLPGGGIACYALVAAQFELVELATELNMIDEDVLKAPLEKEEDCEK